MNASALQGRRVAVGVGGGIAAYKACELVRELRRAGAEVRVAMTEAAQRFVTALTFQNLSNHSVLTDYFDPAQEETFGHIELARWADLFVVAPVTADLLARLRAGMASDPVTTTLCAFRGPVLLAPSMNTAMWENPRTRENLEALLADPRFASVGPGAGELACGEVGDGRLAEVRDIASAASRLVGSGPLSGVRVLVTAGPTREYLDPVRFLSNPSTGKMGYALAEAARARGAEVTLVSGPVSLEPPRGVTVVPVVSAEEMADAVWGRLEALNVVVAAAAVSDWRPSQRLTQKQKKTEGGQALQLERTPDVLAEVARRAALLQPRPLLIGFAAETERVLEGAREKLRRKTLDLIVANDVSASGVGFAGERNRVVLIDRAGTECEVEGTKRQVAEAVWDAISRLRSVPADPRALDRE